MLLEEGDRQRVAVLNQSGEWIESGDRAQLGGSADEGRHVVAERGSQVALDLLLQRGGVPCAGGEEDVATGDHGLHVVETELLEQATKTVHPDDVPSHVDGAQEGDITAHSRSFTSGTVIGGWPAAFRFALSDARPLVRSAFHRDSASRACARARSAVATCDAVGATSASCIAITAAVSALLAASRESDAPVAPPRRPKPRPPRTAAGATESSCARKAATSAPCSLASAEARARAWR